VSDGHVHISLAASAEAALVNVAQNTLVGGRPPARWGNAHANLVPYQLFQASDRPLVVAVGNDPQWQAAMRALELPELGNDEALATNAGRLAQRERVVGAIGRASPPVPRRTGWTVSSRSAFPAASCAPYPRYSRNSPRPRGPDCRRVCRARSDFPRPHSASTPPWFAPPGGTRLRPSAEDRPEHAATLLRSPGAHRPVLVATRAAVNGGTGTLSGKQNPRYSIVVRTTEPEQVVDQDDSDQRVIQRVLAGDRDEFTVLITRYSDPLYRHALCMTGSPDVAEDILQLSFIKAYQHLAEVRGRFDAWVFRIVANGCKDWLKNIRRSHLSYDEDDQPSGYATPEEELDRTELRSDLDVALSSLPASLREAFVMKHVEGRSYEEMADLLGTTVGALKMRVHRAREALQALLEEKYA
jgi:RNA polymerase sigma-70 factor (ECF subfamily)